MPSEVGPALDAANQGLAVLPKEKIDALLTETSNAVGGLGPALQRLVDSTTNVAQGFKDNLPQVNDIIANSAPILDSQVQSGDNIEQWSRNLDVIASQSAEQDAALRSGLEQAAPTLDQVNKVFSGVRDSLPQTLANLSIVIDMLKRYNKGLEQTLVILPQGAAASQAGTLFEDLGQLPLALSINQPPPCLTGFLPASEWRSPADTSMAPLPKGTYCKIPKDYQGNVVRGARNYPCVDVPGKRAATPMECRSPEPYVPLGTNPWYGDPNQILSCPAPGARCDQGVNPGRGVIPAPTVNNGVNPAPADQLPPPQSTAPISDPLSPPGQGTVSCSGQQPNPCIYTPAPGPPGSTAVYSPSSGQVVGPDGVRYNVSNSSNTRRRRMEGDAGTRQLNPTDADEAPDESLAVSTEPPRRRHQTDPDPRSETEEAAAEPTDTRRPSRLGRGWVAVICAGLLVLAVAGAVAGYLAAEVEPAERQTSRGRKPRPCRPPGIAWPPRMRPTSRR